MSFKSVLLPAPLRPHQRQRVAAVGVQADVVKGEEVFVSAARRGVADLAVGVFLAAQAGEPAAQVGRERARADGAEAVLLGNAVDLQCAFRHGALPLPQTVSMKVFSMRENIKMPTMKNTSVMPTDSGM